MDDSQRKAQLNLSLKKAMGLSTLVNSPEYQNFLLPYLKELSLVHPINIENYKSEEEYHFALKNNNARASVYAELINFLASQDIIMKKIREELEKPKKNYGI